MTIRHRFIPLRLIQSRKPLENINSTQHFIDHISSIYDFDVVRECHDTVVTSQVFNHECTAFETVARCSPWHDDAGIVEAVEAVEVGVADGFYDRSTVALSGGDGRPVLHCAVVCEASDAGERS